MRGAKAPPTDSDDRAARIREAVAHLCTGVVEIRMLAGRWTHSGYYNTATPDGIDALVRDVLAHDGKVTGTYYTLNELDPRCLRRAHNKIRERVDGETTADSNVRRRRLLGLDFDVKRPSGTSASDTEVQAALSLARDAQAWLIELGVPDHAIILGMTGNGACLLVRIDEPNNDDTTTLVKRCIAAVACRYNTVDVQIDPRVSNASRIWRLPGTVAAKGDADCPDAPQRRAEILEASAVRVLCPRDILQRLADQAPAEEKGVGTWHPATGTFDLGEWIARHGVSVKRSSPWEDGSRWVLENCLTDTSHTHGSAYIVRRGHGGIAAGCQHASCTWGWRELRAHYEPTHATDQSASSDPRESGGTTSARLYPVVSAREALRLPPVTFRIAGYMPERGTGALIGFSGDGKGVVSIDQAVALAMGQPWRGLAVQPCPVVIVVAEGWGGIPQRIRACLDYRQVPVELDVPLYLIPAAPKLNVPVDLRRLIDTISALPQTPRVAIVDTLSRTLLGNENLAEDMGPYCDALQEIATAMDGFALTIHHTGWDKSRERASTVLRGAVDMMAMVAREEGVITLSCSKPKDFAEFAPMRFRLQPHLESVVIMPIGDADDAPVGEPTSLRELPRTVRTVMETLRDSFGDDGASATTLLRTSGVNERSYFRALKEARGWGLITKVKQIYQLTIRGREVLTCH